MAKKVNNEELNLLYINNNRADKKSAPKNKKAKKSKNTKNIKNINKNKHSKRKISKKKVAIFITKWTSIIALIVGGMIFLTTTPIFNIKNINIVGNNQVTYDQIVSLSELSKDTNIFKNSKSKIEKNIKTNTYIKKVTIKRRLPDTIEITVEEKQKMFMLQFVNGYAYIDNQGYILEIVNKKTDLPILKGYSTSEDEISEGNRLCSDDLEKLENSIKIMQAVKEVGIEYKITNIDIANKKEYSLYIESEKKKIYLGDASNLTDKMLYAKAILESEKKNEGEIFLNGDLNNKFQPYFREKV